MRWGVGGDARFFLLIFGARIRRITYHSLHMYMYIMYVYMYEVMIFALFFCFVLFCRGHLDCCCTYIEKKSYAGERYYNMIMFVYRCISVIFFFFPCRHTICLCTKSSLWRSQQTHPKGSRPVFRVDFLSLTFFRFLLSIYLHDQKKSGRRGQTTDTAVYRNLNTYRRVNKIDFDFS